MTPLNGQDKNSHMKPAKKQRFNHWFVTTPTVHHPEINQIPKIICKINDDDE